VNAGDYHPGPVFDTSALLAKLREVEADAEALRDENGDLRTRLAIEQRRNRMRGLRRWIA
jgi:hypothetical protein